MTVLCTEADASRATVEVRLVIDADRSRSIRVHSSLAGRLDRDRVHAVAAGRNEVRLSFGVDEPGLWWPWSLGPQPLSTIRVEAYVDDELSHVREARTGLRQVSMSNLVLSINGERLFAKGVMLQPPSAYLGNVSEARLRADITSAREAGLDLVRVGAHVSLPALYDAADELGMLVWQDLPMRGSFVRTARRQAMRQAVEAVAAVGHHPSIVVWCGHDSPYSSPPSTRLSLRSARATAKAVLPSWNRTVLDGWLRSAFRAADTSRPALSNSGTLPHLPLLDATDTHLGWSSSVDLGRLAARLPRLVRWVTGLSPASVPVDADFMEPDLWPALDWESLERDHNFEPEAFESEVPPLAYRTFGEWQSATQAMQARELRAQIETLRRLKYQPTAGFTIAHLADGERPTISPGLIDHAGHRKPAFDAVMQACRPVIVVIDQLPPVVHPGESHTLAVHAVSDLRTAVEIATASAEVTQAGEARTIAWEGIIDADACVLIGSIPVDVGERPGPLVIEVTLLAGEHMARARTSATIRRLP